MEALAAAERDDRDLTADESVLVQRWHGWGAAPQFFDRPEFTRERARLRDLVGDAGVAAAARTTLNAHYTDAILVDAMWRAVGDLGPPSGVFIEAGCGRGVFLSRAPAAWSGLGVELDPTTARVARALVDGRHQVVNDDFATVAVAAGRAGAVVGNVPFGSIRLFDPTHNPGRRLPIHDHFLAKASSALVPGGIAVVLTSRYTLDKLDDGGRQAIGAHADFLGAVRLPSTAHQAEAGTSVVTDMVVLRGRAAGENARHAPGWQEPPVTITEWDGHALAEPIRISGYYTAHPEQVLGRVELDHAMFALDMVVRPTGDLAEQIGTALAAVAAANRGRGRPGPVGAVRPRDLLATVEPGPPAPLGRIERDGVEFRRSGLTAWEDHHPPSTTRVELRWLIDLRDHADALVAAEAEPTVGDDVLAAQRSALAAEHARYVRQFGPVNRVKVNADTGYRTYPKMGGFRKDPGFPRVAALELYDEVLNRAQPAALLRGRVVKAAAPVERADTPGDALALSLQQRGRVDMAYIAALLDSSEDEALAALGDRLFEDPEQRSWVTSQEYLSGDVRAKLAAAVAAAENRPELAVNVAALQEVQPVDVVATDLQGTLGAPWVDERYVTAFARSLSPARAEIRASIRVARAQTTGQWEVSASTEAKAGMRVGHPYGGERFDALRVLQDRLNGRPTVITRTVDGKSVVDPEATAAAEEKAESMSDAFDHWLLTEDADRARHVLERYNNQFNSYVARSYAGMLVNPPGLRASFELRPHQHQAVARIVHGGNTLLAHPVGAGKTAEMIVGAMELRRLGLIRLPAFVVPNHMLEQFSRDVVDLYPAAAVLTLDSDDLNDKGRAMFAARVQSGDWDAIVVTHNSFGAWPMSPAAVADDIRTRLTALRADIARMAGADVGATLTKKLEKKLVNDEERLKAVTAAATGRQDEHTFYFDHPGGVDWVAIDEAQEFKNAELISSARQLRGVPNGEGAQKAQDLAMKLRYLQRRHPGRPVVTFATGTPVSNTAAEIWVMARYLRPDLCQRLGVATFDDFRAQFCDTTSAMELDASGTKMKRVERLAKYKNLPELARMVGEFADVVRVEDLGLPRPELAGGAREIVVIEPDPGLVDFMTNTVAARADDIHHRRVKPHEDNNLKLTTHCRLASFDWASFSGQDIDERHSMLATAANRIAKTYHAHVGDTFLTPSGGVHPRPGSLQLVFSDLGTPHEDRNDTAYDRLRAMLVTRGVPDGQIGFIHHHDGSDESKARFFEMCRDGRISVAMSSTAKMGIGTNVQDRLYAIHHLDVPWRPDFIEQREGRGLRQGNQHRKIEIVAYATERSFSATGWQTVQRKAGFVGQLMRADPDGPRTLEAVDEQTLSYGQIKAMATGDPAFLEMADLDDRIARLSRLERAHSQEIAALARRQRNLADQIQVTSATLEALRPLAARVARCDPEAPWRVEIAGVGYKNRAEAARALDRHLPRYGASRPLRFVDAAIEYGWRAGTQRDEPGRLELLTAPAPGVRPPVVVVDDRTEPGLMGALTRCTNQVGDLPRKVGAGEVKLGELRSQMAQVEGADRSEFPRREELVAARHRLTQLSAELAQRYAPPEPARDGPTPPTGGAPAVPDDGAAPPPKSIPAEIDHPQGTARLGAGADVDPHLDPGADDTTPSAQIAPVTAAPSDRPEHGAQQRGPRRITARIPGSDTHADGPEAYNGAHGSPRGPELHLLAPAFTPEVTKVSGDAHPWPPPEPVADANPLIAERTRLQSELLKLETLANAHRAKVQRLQRRRADAVSQACAVGQKARSCQAALERGVDTRGDRFTWTVVDPAHYSFTEYRSRAEAGQQLRLALLALLERPRPVDQQPVGPGAGTIVHTAPMGHLCSFRVEAELTTWPDGPANVTLRIANRPLNPVTVEHSDLTDSDPAQVVAALENRINTIAETAAGYRAEELAFRRLEARIDARLAQPFEHQPRVDALRTRLRDIEEILTPADSNVVAPPPPTATIRRLPRRPRPDDPTTVTDYDDCPMCLSSDLRSIGEYEADQVRCKECGWIGSYPPHPRLVAVRDPPPPSADPEAHVSPGTPSTSTADQFAIGARLTPSSTAGGTTDDPYAPAVESGSGTLELGPAPPQGAAAAPLPSIHQEHQLHQQLYPAPQPAPIIIQP